MKSIMEEASSIMEAIQKGWERAGKPHEFSVKVFEDAQTAFFGMRTVKSAKIALFYKEGAPSFTQEKIDSSNRPAKRQEERRDRSLDGQRERRPDDRRDSRPRDERAPRAQAERPSRQEDSRRTEGPAAPTRPERAGRPTLREDSPQVSSGQAGQAAPQKPRELRPLQDKRAHAESDTAHSAAYSAKDSKDETASTDRHATPRGGAWNDEMIGWVNTWVKQTLAHAGHTNIDFSTESSRNLLRIDFSKTITGDEKKERLLFSSFAHLIMSSLRNKFKGDLKHLKVVLNSK